MMLGKIIALIAMRRSIPFSSVLLQRLLAGLATVLSLSLLVAFLGSILLAGLICMVYHSLLVYGMSQDMAMMWMGMGGLIILCLSVAVIFYYVKRIKDLALEAMMGENPIAQKTSRIVYAFLNGLLS